MIKLTDHELKSLIAEAARGIQGEVWGVGGGGTKSFLLASIARMKDLADELPEPGALDL